MKLKKFLSYEWDAIAGIVTAVTASVLHLLHMLDEEVMLSVVLALIALLFINFMRHTRNNEITAEQVDRTEAEVRKIHAGLELPEVVLVGPRHLRTNHEQFLKHMKGDSIWFNVCLSMYRTQALFDALLRPAIENPTVLSIQFILDDRQKDVWRETILPKINACTGHAKVHEPRWCSLGKEHLIHSRRQPRQRRHRGLAQLLGRAFHGRGIRASGSAIYLPCTEEFRVAAASGRTRSLLPTPSGCRRVTH
jgi:hypothetical protein